MELFGSGRSGAFVLPAVGRRRRRLVASLLLGFAALWLTAAFARLCCTGFELPRNHDAAPAQIAAELAADHTNSTPSSSRYCPEFTTPDAVPPPMDLATVSDQDRGLVAPIQSDSAMLRVNRLALSVNTYGLPPPRVPLYLRNQRFLI